MLRLSKLLLCFALLAATNAVWGQNVQIASLNLNGAQITLNASSIKANWIGPLPASQIFSQVLPNVGETYSAPANCTNSRAESTVAATASSTLTLYKCSAAGFTTCSSVGTIVFAAAGKVGTFTCSSAFSLVGSSSNSFYIQGPSVADTTLANISIALYTTHN